MERQDRSKPLVSTTVRAPRRHTTIDLNRVRNSLYTTVAASVQFISVDPQYDSEVYYDDGQVPTRQSRSHYLPQGGYYEPSWQSRYAPSPTIPQSVDLRGEEQRVPPNPFDDAYRVGGPANEKQRPFDGSNAVPPATQAAEKPTPPAAEPEQPYHIFSEGRKKLLIGIIGVAGLFSGLSSNIFFPSLDAIAKASQPSCTSSDS